MDDLEQETLITTGSVYFQTLQNAIDAASETIDIEVYIFERDEIGLRIAESLKAAAARQVIVRLLLDGFGSASVSASFLRSLRESGVEVRIYHPLPWHFWHWRGDDGFFKLFRRINHRNHRKVCVVDKKIALIGSFNVSSVHLEKSQGGAGWRDCALLLTNVDVEPLVKAFLIAWARRFWRVRRGSSDRRFRLNDSALKRRAAKRDLYQKMSSARHRIWLANAYFVPGFRLLKILASAAKKGIDVRLLLPKKSDVIFMPWVSSVFYQLLLQSGVKIYEYQPAMMHQKVIMLDQWSVLGSTNLNYRSFLHDLEVDVVVQSPSVHVALKEHLLNDMKLSQRVSLKELNSNILRRFLGRLFGYFRRWL